MKRRRLTVADVMPLIERPLRSCTAGQRRRIAVALVERVNRCEPPPDGSTIHVMLAEIASDVINRDLAINRLN